MGRRSRSVKNNNISQGTQMRRERLKLTSSKLSLIALLAKVSTSSSRVSLICWSLLLVSKESVSPMIAGQKGRHSWLSIEERVTINRESCSQIMRQKSQTVLSKGCCVTINSRRSKKPEKPKKKFLTSLFTLAAFIIPNVAGIFCGEREKNDYY